jgi:signal transduction histidine kinase/ActR/RegA family two-component response regulator
VSDPTDDRSRLFVLRYYERRREVLTTTPRDADPGGLFKELARAAIPDFASWVSVVDRNSTEGAFSSCAVDHDHSFRSCRQRCDNGLDLDNAIAEVVRSGETLVWNDDGHGPRGVISPLVVEDVAAGVVVIARESSATPWNEDDLEAIHDVVTALGVDLERLRLRYASRLSLRASQRVASRLHQLISASLVLGALSDESAIAQHLSRSARSVFDADRAIVALGENSSRVVSLTQRGRAARVVDPAEVSDLPVPRANAREPWNDHGWLCAPVLDSRRRTRGVVAVHRLSPVTFGEEDRELTMLLGQLATTALEALDLNRTIIENEKRLRILVDAAPVGIVESEAEGDVRWWNQSASRLLRWPDFASDARESVRWPESVEPFLRNFWRDLLAGGLRDTQEIATQLGGRERVLAVSAAVVPSSEGRPHVLTLIDDVSDQRELREEVRHAHRMELRGQVASSVAHDFNNLMTLILGYSELLSRHVAGDNKSEELVRDIQATSSRASTLTAQLQSLGRTSVPTRVRLDVGAALSANAEVLERIMGSRNTIVWSLAESTPPVTIDADLFEQMILNLSINARDAMPSGGTLRISTTVEEVTGAVLAEESLAPGTYVVVSIADTGIGMDEVTLARCFEPLFTTKGPFKGTGLGLASARRLVEESAGVINCSSRLGAGTTFTIWLPAFAVDDDPAVHELDDTGMDRDASARTSRAPLSGTILLCEDDAGLRRLALQVLRRNGFDVLETASAEEALEQRSAYGDTIDLLVSDVVLPLMAGSELAAQLQEEQPSLRVLLMSGTATDDVISHLREGSATFLAKPFRPSQLVDAVVSLLSRRAVARS